MNLVDPNQTTGDVDPRVADAIRGWIASGRLDPMILAHTYSLPQFFVAGMTDPITEVPRPVDVWTLHRARGWWPFIGDATREAGIYEWLVAESAGRQVAGDATPHRFVL